MSEAKEKCAVFGIFGEGLDVSRLSFFGLFALQHRGQEGSGIAVGDGTSIVCHKNVGLVTQVYTEEAIQGMKGFCAIGHNRYSTSRGTGLLHAQPVTIGDSFTLAHNGNLPSTTALEEFLKKHDVGIEGKNDSELMAEAIAYYIHSGHSIKESIKYAFPLFTGAFSLVVMTKDALVAVRDGWGIRPLVMGKLNGGFVFASETCAFHAIGAEFLREVVPGEMVIVTKAGVESVQIVPPSHKLDIFEFVYFARPDSVMLGKSVYQVRRNFGMRLAEEYRPDADLVVPVPETAIPMAIGYANQSGIPLELGLIKNRYIHRTFIQPDQHSRDLGVKLKLVPLPEVIRGKRIILIDDSIVRGTTSRPIVKSLFDAGAAEVHFLVSSPPVQFPDFYGIDTPAQKDLIAADNTLEEIREFLGATSLYYLSLSGLIAATGLSRESFNTSCFTGEYPIDLRERASEVRHIALMQEAQRRIFSI